MREKFRVLHFTFDEKFFDGVFSTWENNPDFVNHALFYTPNKSYSFNFIKRTDVLEIYHKKDDVRIRLLKDDYDIVFLHSMPYPFYQFVSWIPDNRIVIWWGWGYDIYGSQGGVPPILKIDLYKPKTYKYCNIFHWGLNTILNTFKAHFFKNQILKLQNTAIHRIDYFQPVVKMEIDLMRRNKLFRAKEFYYKVKEPITDDINPKPLYGNILLGNSATPTNNHLDVLEKVLQLKNNSQTIIMPLNYGENKYKLWLKFHLPNSDILPIYNYLPRDEYFQLVNQCSYAVFGTLRQQAMGNVSFAISKGIKVFLYKDSVIYRNLNSLGYVVFSIEDMTIESLTTPLTIEQMEQNNKARLSEYNRRTAIYHNVMEEISKRRIIP